MELGWFPLAVIFLWKCTFCQHLPVWGITHSLLEGYNFLLPSSFFHTTIWDGSDESGSPATLLGDFFLGQDFSKFINKCMNSFSAYLDGLADRSHPKVSVGNLRFLLPISQPVILPDLSADSVSYLYLCFCSQVCQVSMFLWFLIWEWWASSLQATANHCPQSTQATIKMADQLVRQFRDRNFDSSSQQWMSLVLCWPEDRNFRTRLWFILFLYYLNEPHCLETIAKDMIKMKRQLNLQKLHMTQPSFWHKSYKRSRE